MADTPEDKRRAQKRDKPAESDREARRAKALKANLRRRKAAPPSSEKED